ncbi:hypothetical protein [Rhodoferax sp.]|uniref:hypothetical protein n=1 Tax=Rhodoferax sp. TaxID=50421 RepID=UPI00276D9857|nr:hypothetical protein [Rhodoferax sp.]
MDQTQLASLTNFNWNIAEDVLRDIYVRGKYRDVIQLRDHEQVPLLATGGMAAFIRREVLPYTPDVGIVEAGTKIGYEVSFTRHFYKRPELRTLAQISADILALEQESEGLLSEITGGAAR